ncbi:DUF5677 domain-containing protein [Phyllobacterium zundukense]|uniref:Uncharacterized protein n=1 Tax=Phyllobacterium zundukense TaxID=1867719 RepID=A0A2N9W068_9HYPH|nr:DUF5677 domain-containing protein [Phyllobacterium zundukense]ATU90625.1 hypothetical protein BLM14_02345 [Phyllobacterium zundukense]PIO45136.1 hypothetical protein B5P45_08815 [Phyllobacterium zundukense]
MLNYILDLHAKALELVPALKFDAQQEIQRTLVSLYATILEQSESAAILLKAQKTAGTGAILRSLLEARVDLAALLNNEQHLQGMKASFYKEWIKLLTEGVKGENEYLGGFADNDRAKEKLAEYKQAKEELRLAGFKPLKVEDRFEKAGMGKEYRSIYNLLSNDSHNGIQALNDRHVEALNGTLEVVIYNPDDPTVTLDSIAGILLTSSLDTHQYFKSGKHDDFAELDARLAVLRKERDG